MIISPPYVTTDSLSAPDGTYLHIDFVIEVLEGMASQRWEGQEVPAEATDILSRTPFRDTAEYFRMRAL